MPITVYERHLSGDFAISRESATLDREFFATGSTDQGAIELAVIAEAGVAYYGLIRSDIRAKHQGGLHWFVTISYANIPLQQAAALQPSEALDGDPNKVGTPGPTEDIGPSFGFDFSGQTIKIFQSRETKAAKTAGAGGGAVADKDNALAIGLSKDSVEGCDIYAPSGAFEREAFRTAVTLDYLKTIYQLTGTVNFGHKFFTFEKGEVLYLGASGRMVQFSKWSITHKFAVAFNEAPFVMCRDKDGNATIEFAEKAGWDYAWARYESREVGTPPSVIQVPVKGFIERVYRSGNLLLLGIGG